MQIRFKKKLFFFLWVLFIPNDSKTQTNKIIKTDSVFLSNQRELFDNRISLDSLEHFSDFSKIKLLKNAYISEGNKKNIEVLCFLCLAYVKEPNTHLLNKINDIAVNNGLEGYETDDWAFVLLVFKNYFYSAYLVFFILGIYVFSVLFFKFLKKQSIPARHRWAVLIYMIAIFVALNLPKTYSIGIITNKHSLLRLAASASGPVSEVIKTGNKINIIGENDIWFRVLWHKNIYFIRKSDVLLIY